MNKKIDGSSKKFLPIWVWVIALIQIFLILFFAIGTALNPEGFISESAQLDYVTMLYIIRNVTIVIGIIVALLLKSRLMLFGMLLVRMLTDVADVFAVYVFNVEVIKSSVPMVVAILIVPALVALCFLWKRISQEEKL